MIFSKEHLVNSSSKGMEWKNLPSSCSSDEEYTNGKTPAFLIAKELGAERFEVELLIGDAEKFTKPLRHKVSRK